MSVSYCCSFGAFKITATDIQLPLPRADINIVLSVLLALHKAAGQIRTTFLGRVSMAPVEDPEKVCRWHFTRFW